MARLLSNASQSILCMKANFIITPMIDLVAILREKIFRQPKLGKTPLAGEELSEKGTTKMGNMLLV